jgi:hypothetical protein
LKKSLDKATSAIAEKDETIRQLTAQVDQLDFMLKRSNLKCQSRIEHLERQKKVIEVQGKAKLVSCETEHNVKLDDLRRQWETEKIGLYAFLAEQFQIYFEPGQALDDTGFRQIVSRVKNEFNRHQKQELAIRKLVKAREGQTTAEALMDVVFSSRDDFGTRRVRLCSERVF